MSVIMSQNGHAALELTLHTAQEHEGWMGYNIRGLVTVGAELQEFLRPVEQKLFFEDRIEPEVPRLLLGLSKVAISEQEIFQFEPLDERDFRLEVFRESSLISINLFIDNALVFNQCNVTGTSVGLKLYVTATELNAFADSINAGYNNLRG